MQCKCLLKHKSKLCVCECVWVSGHFDHQFVTVSQQHDSAAAAADSTGAAMTRWISAIFGTFLPLMPFCVGYRLSVLSHTILSCRRSAALLLWLKTISIHFVYWICQCRSNLYFFTYNVLHLHRCAKTLNSITLFLCKFSGFSIRKGWWKLKKLKRKFLCSLCETKNTYQISCNIPTTEHAWWMIITPTFVPSASSMLWLPTPPSYYKSSIVYLLQPVETHLICISFFS